jgi:hypothetical protein
MERNNKYLETLKQSLQDAGITWESFLTDFRYVPALDEDDIPDEYCTCGHRIQNLRFVQHGDIIVQLGSCCIKRFIPKENRGKRCTICDAYHQNRTKEVCTTCFSKATARDKMRKQINTIVTFGKYSGKSIGDIFNLDKSYFRFLDGLDTIKPDIRNGINTIKQIQKNKNSKL